MTKPENKKDPFLLACLNPFILPISAVLFTLLLFAILFIELPSFTRIFRCPSISFYFLPSSLLRHPFTTCIRRPSTRIFRRPFLFPPLVASPPLEEFNQLLRKPQLV